MKQSKLKKFRWCDHCQREIYGDAEKLQEHVALHRLADRLEKSGLVMPDMGIVVR